MRGASPVKGKFQPEWKRAMPMRLLQRLVMGPTGDGTAEIKGHWGSVPSSKSDAVRAK
jgi:hypothetical protein